MVKNIKQIKYPGESIEFVEGWSKNLIPDMAVLKIGIYGRPGLTFKFNLLNEINPTFVLNNTGFFQMDVSDVPITALYLKEENDKMQMGFIIDLVYISAEVANNG